MESKKARRSLSRSSETDKEQNGKKENSKEIDEGDLGRPRTERSETPEAWDEIPQSQALPPIELPSDEEDSEKEEESDEESDENVDDSKKLEEGLDEEAKIKLHKLFRFAKKHKISMTVMSCCLAKLAREVINEHRMYRRLLYSLKHNIQEKIDEKEKEKQ